MLYLDRGCGYMNRRGFTLVELLAVIVILGIVLTIAIPATSNYITNSRRESFVTVMKEYTEAVRKEIVSGNYQAPMDPNTVTLVSLDLISLDKGKKESSFDSEWIKNKSYVAVVNVGTSEEAKYEYYIAAQDEKNYALPLMNITDVTKTSIISNAKNKMEVTIQALCGTVNGKTYKLPTIKGLEEVQPLDEKQNKIDWNATIYSSEDCAP